MDNPSIDTVDGNKSMKINEMDIMEIITSSTCYELMETRSKMIVIDILMKPQQALNALLDVGERAALLFDSRTRNFEGMFTITDFLGILDLYYDNKCTEADINEKSIESWRKVIIESDKSFLIFILPDDSILKAIRSLCIEKIHRLPMFDIYNKNPLGTISHKKIINFLYEKICNKLPSIFFQTIEKLGIGTYTDLVTIQYNTLIKDAIKLFVSHKVSCLPVVDATGRLINVYSKADIINLALDKGYLNHDYKVSEALGCNQAGRTILLTCKPTDALHNIINKLATGVTPRIFVLDENETFVGIISLADISSFLIRK